MSEVFDIYTLLFLVLAVVIFIRLRNVLGRRTGNERPPYDPYSASENSVGAKGAKSDTVVRLPQGESASAPSGMPQPTAADIEAKLEDVAPKDSPLAKSLTEIMKADPNFDPANFLEGAKVAYEMIIVGFAEGDTQMLKELLDEDVYGSFSRAIAERKERGEKAEMTLVGINKADIIEAELKGGFEHVTVKFVSEVISLTRDAENKIIEGDPEHVREVTDIWTFARETASRNPNWKLVATETAN